MKIYCDGSGTNGRTSGYCVIAGNGSHIEYKILGADYTNNEMEYAGMIRALEIAQGTDIVLSDSQLVVNQIAGKWKVKEPRLKPLADKARKILKGKPGVSVKWIPRIENLAGHYIEAHQ